MPMHFILYQKDKARTHSSSLGGRVAEPVRPHLATCMAQVTFLYISLPSLYTGHVLCLYLSPLCLHSAQHHYPNRFGVCDKNKTALAIREKRTALAMACSL